MVNLILLFYWWSVFRLRRNWKWDPMPNLNAPVTRYQIRWLRINNKDSSISKASKHLYNLLSFKNFIWLGCSMIVYDNSTKTGVSKTASDPLKQAQSLLSLSIYYVTHKVISTCEIWFLYLNLIDYSRVQHKAWFSERKRYHWSLSNSLFTFY